MSTSEAGVRRGDPLLFLAAILAGWVIARSVTFSPLWQDASQRPFSLASPHQQASLSPGFGMVSSDTGPAEAVDPMTVGTGTDLMAPAAGNRLLADSVAHIPALSSDSSDGLRVTGLVWAQDRRATQENPGLGTRHQPVAAEPIPARVTIEGRWSADGWLLVRNETTTPVLSGHPSYGRSQAGAVIRYSLAPASRLRPQAYLRASAALAGAREQEIAAGVSARPLAGVPLRLAAEARVSEMALGTRLRPAVFAVTEFPPLRLPLDARAEVYAQGGYVGGDYATAFADGQARIERPLARRGRIELSAGAGAWGGAQRDAARLDIGPTAAVTFPLGEGRGRVAADYRFRVAGDAEPSSGPALTVSAGF